MSTEAQSQVRRGVLCFHSETGTEGGYWAFQDERHIAKKPSAYGVWEGSEVFDADAPERRGVMGEVVVIKDGRELALPDPISRDPDYVASSLFRGEGRGDRAADARLMERYGFRIIYAAEHWDERFGAGNWHYENGDEGTVIAPDGTRYHSGGTPRTEPHRPYGTSAGDVTRGTVRWDDGTEEERSSDTLLTAAWDYAGLHVLADGDDLTIFDADRQTPVWRGMIALHQHPLFTESAGGMWIHADQEGVERETWARWFFDGLPADLRTAA